MLTAIITTLMVGLLVLYAWKFSAKATKFNNDNTAYCKLENEDNYFNRKFV